MVKSMSILLCFCLRATVISSYRSKYSSQHADRLKNPPWGLVQRGESNRLKESVRSALKSQKIHHYTRGCSGFLPKDFTEKLANYNDTSGNEKILVTHWSTHTMQGRQGGTGFGDQEKYCKECGVTEV